MKPERKLAETTTREGARLALYEHDGSYAIRLDGQTLMHSAISASELQLGELAVKRLTDQSPAKVLIGGLGLGFSLKSVLAKVATTSVIHVAELIPQVVEWNREYLATVNGMLVDDPRVTIFIDDIWNVLTRAAEGLYDAIVIDIDNGPAAMVQKPNFPVVSSERDTDDDGRIKARGSRCHLVGGLGRRLREPAFQGRLSYLSHPSQALP